MSVLRLNALVVILFASTLGCRTIDPSVSDPDPVASPVAKAISESIPEPRRITLEGDVVVTVDGGRVEMPGWIALSEGWLEVAVCRQGTREHEAIVATVALPSVVHSGLLLAGFKPGSPARYRAEMPPLPASGDHIEIDLMFELDQQRVTIPLGRAIDDERGDPAPEWVFAGSGFRPNPPSLGPGEFYVADYAGTLIGLTTFGDEMLAAVEVRSPEIGVDPPVWQIRPGVLPPEGTPVTVVYRRPTSAD
ncbi:MAG: hypothetical protein CMJ51_07400 [Planctomycetaceae bacterium]|nr:hypothetical protein [Planctomycetaceae bacterium]